MNTKYRIVQTRIYTLHTKEEYIVEESNRSFNDIVFSWSFPFIHIVKKDVWERKYSVIWPHRKYAEDYIILKLNYEYSKVNKVIAIYE